jgi:hypothetical protein
MTIRATPAYPLDRPGRLSLESVARAARLHPDLVRRFVALGLLGATHDAAGRPWFTWQDVVTLGRIQRLHAGLSLNYAAIGLVLDLLDRIRQLEARSTPWTRTG